jgi:alkylation response protein AidB-like acyl-CoA dehydrogenase
MDLSLNENQELLKNTAREFVLQEYPKDTLLEMDRQDVGYTDEGWRQIAQLGWLGIAIPQEYGGEGGSLTDAGVLFQELGRGPVPGPLFSSSVLGASVVLEAGREEQKRQILPAIASGNQILALAVSEADYGWAPDNVHMTAERTSGGYRLNGLKLFVQDATSASHIICAVRTQNGGGPSDGVSLLVVDANSPGVSVRNLPGFIRSNAEVKFDSVEVPESALLGEQPGQGWPALEKAVERSIPVLCAYKVGGSEIVYEMSVEYSRTRVQFSVPIGKFQRVQDHIINLVNQLDAARWTTYEALWKLDLGRPAASSVHLAKAVSSEAFYQACNHAHEVHAGLGSMTEYGLILYTKMSRSLFHYLGDPRYHRKKLADALEL